MSDPRPPDEVLRYYARGGESGRIEAEVREESEPSLLGATPHLLAVGRR